MYNYPYGDNQQINLNWIISEIIALHQRLDPDYTAPTFTQIYPFSETQQLNLDWILTELKALKELAPTPAPTDAIDEVGHALIAGAYDSDTQYQKNDYIVQEGKLYRANAATTGTFDPTKWREVILGDDLAIITRWADATNTYLNNLAASNVSNDSIVAGDTVKDALATLNGAINNQKSRFNGKKISILGDSIETFDQTGYKISGYRMYYPNHGVTDVNQTWWKQVIDTSGAKLEVNASFSGSRVTNTAPDSSYPDFYDRCNLLGSPNMIFVSLGTNDSANSVSLGSYDFTTTYTSLSEATFRTAYIKGMKALMTNYPDAEIVAIIEQMADSYKESIVYICQTLGINFIFAADYTTASGVHPGVKGMQEIAALVLYPTDSTLTQAHMPADALATGGKLDGSTYVSDANTYGDSVSNPTFFRINSNTLHTPYKDGLTGYSNGIIIEYRSSATQATQICMESGSARLFMRREYSSSWTPWLMMQDSQTVQKGRDSVSVTPGSIVTRTIQFPTAFAYTPEVTVTPAGRFTDMLTLTGIGYSVPGSGITTTGFEIQVALPSGSSISTMYFEWVAVG